MKTNKGLSLIVLVITVIVMIILAGTVILSLNSTNIINKASETVSQANVKQVQVLAENKWVEMYFRKKMHAVDAKYAVISALQQELGAAELEKYNVKFTEKGVKVEAREDTSIPENATEIVGEDGLFKYVVLVNGDIQITRYMGPQETNQKVTIPAKYDGYDVYSIGHIATDVVGGLNYNIFSDEKSNKNTTITSLIIEEGIKAIKDAAFNWCQGLTGELVLPNTIESIGQFAFNGCMGLTGDLEIPIGVTRIEKAAFQQCYGLTGKLKLPTCLEYIGVGAFIGCNFTGTLTIPKGVTTIDTYAFYSCVNLEGPLTLPERAITIGTYAFYSCSNLGGTLIIPKEVTTIGAYAFEGCKITSLEFAQESNLKTIGMRAFFNNLISGELAIPEGVETIGERAFRHCSMITSLSLPTTIKRLDSRAFADCYGLNGKVIQIPTSTTVDATAFEGCKVTIQRI